MSVDIEGTKTKGITRHKGAVCNIEVGFHAGNKSVLGVILDLRYNAGSNTHERSEALEIFEPLWGQSPANVSPEKGSHAEVVLGQTCLLLMSMLDAADKQSLEELEYSIPVELTFKDGEYQSLRVMKELLPLDTDDILRENENENISRTTTSGGWVTALPRALSLGVVRTVDGGSDAVSADGSPDTMSSEAPTADVAQYSTWTDGDGNMWQANADGGWIPVGADSEHTSGSRVERVAGRMVVEASMGREPVTTPRVITGARRQDASLQDTVSDIDEWGRGLARALASSPFDRYVERDVLRFITNTVAGSQLQDGLCADPADEVARCRETVELRSHEIDNILCTPFSDQESLPPGSEGITLGDMDDTPVAVDGVMPLWIYMCDERGCAGRLGLSVKNARDVVASSIKVVRVDPDGREDTYITMFKADPPITGSRGYIPLRPETHREAGPLTTIPLDNILLAKVHYSISRFVLYVYGRIREGGRRPDPMFTSD